MLAGMWRKKLSYEIYEALIESSNNFPAEEKTENDIKFYYFRRVRKIDKRDC